MRTRSVGVVRADPSPLKARMVRAQLCDVIIIATIEHGDTYETEAHLSWR
jgi:hypothetical protein